MRGPVRRGFVLAGGRSRRFGSDKAMAELDGAPAVVALVRRMAAAGLEAGVVWRTSRPELGLLEVIEPEGELHHPLLGLAAIEGEDELFVCPCDAITLAPDMIRRLVDARAVATDSPLCGVWPAEVRQQALVWAREGRSVQALAVDLARLDVGSIGNRNLPTLAPST